MDILLNINTALTTTLHNDMLLIKEQLNLPSLPVQFGNGQCLKLEVVMRKR